MYRGYISDFDAKLNQGKGTQRSFSYSIVAIALMEVVGMICVKAHESVVGRPHDFLSELSQATASTL